MMHAKIWPQKRQVMTQCGCIYSGSQYRLIYGRLALPDLCSFKLMIPYPDCPSSSVRHLTWGINITSFPASWIKCLVARPAAEAPHEKSRGSKTWDEQVLDPLLCSWIQGKRQYCILTFSLTKLDLSCMCDLMCFSEFFVYAIKTKPLT